MSYHKILAISAVLFMLIPVVTVSGQQSSEQGAELSVIPIGEIPLVIPNQETIIPLYFTDNFGMNWTTLQNFYGTTGIRAILSFMVTRVIWPIIHPTWKPFLGYTSIKLSTEIVGNPEGWTASINPNTIPLSTDGTKADLSLKVFVNDLTAANTVTVRIAATRILKDGKTEYGTSYFEIPVRSAKLSYIDVKPDAQVKTVAPGSTTTFFIDVTNLGYFVDNFAAKIISDNSVKGTLSQQSFVLQPGETKQIRLQVMTSDIFFDPGTSHTISIEAYSLKYPANRFIGEVQVRTRGVYISPLTAFVMVAVLFVLLIIFLLFRYMFVWRKQRICGGKPDKPWTIPEEKAYLEELKAKDKEEYRKVLQMMENEYRSALLWYEDYCRAMKQEQKGEKSRRRLFPRIFKRSAKPIEKQPKIEEWKMVEQPVIDHKQQDQEAIIERKRFDIVEKEVILDQQKRDKTLAKIQREQEKQRKKLKQ